MPRELQLLRPAAKVHVVCLLPDRLCNLYGVDWCRMLSCFHSFCATCLAQLAKTRQAGVKLADTWRGKSQTSNHIISCPACAVPTCVAYNDANFLPLNFELLHRLHSNGATGFFIPCDVCSRGMHSNSSEHPTGFSLASML
jgi:hypothetical protein